MKQQTVGRNARPFLYPALHVLSVRNFDFVSQLDQPTSDPLALPALDLDHTVLDRPARAALLF